MEPIYFDRDLSWLSFNERVLLQAGNERVPLLDKINFLSIYSSNLDEFYRVRIPALMALQKIKKTKAASTTVLEDATRLIHAQQEVYGRLLKETILPQLQENDIHLLYNESIPTLLQPAIREFFFTHLLAFLQPVVLDKKQTDFFPQNNQLYIAACTGENEDAQVVLINIPTAVPRFFSVSQKNTSYVLFIDDIIKHYLPVLIPTANVHSAYSFKITRDAELDLQDEYEGDIAEKIEKQISKRDLGFATRFLYAPGMPDHLLSQLTYCFNLQKASVVQGGVYHNLKDLANFPVKDPSLSYPSWPAVKKELVYPDSLFNSMASNDIMVHTPYQDYSLVLRFFNEAAIDPDAEEIYVTMYRMAGDSRIAHALISAAKNGKAVTVFVELKARFDEANNIRWAKKMKEAGVKIIYSIPGLKVHAKVALVKKKNESRTVYYGLLATGNFNESTARFYTDHILFTAHKEILRELELLFMYLAKRKNPAGLSEINFDHLLVAQFNLQEKMLALIDREIQYAQQGAAARICIKLNNLEEEILINKLYEASQAGVEVQLMVRSICRIVPGVPGLSDNISVKRIVDRYLEHGRLFWFYNNGQDELFAGSADWMNRNIYRRIEVCFPIYDEAIKKELIHILQLQQLDTVQATVIDAQLQNRSLPTTDTNNLSSQEAIHEYVQPHA